MELVRRVVEPSVGAGDAEKVVQMTEQWCNLWSGLRVETDSDGAAAVAEREQQLGRWLRKLRSLPLGALFESEDKSASMSEASSSAFESRDDLGLAGLDEERWGEVYPMSHYYDLARAACAIDFGLPRGHSDAHDPEDTSSQQVLALLVKLLGFQSMLFAVENRSWAKGWNAKKAAEHKALCVRRLDELLQDPVVADHDATKLRLLALFFLRFPREEAEFQKELLYMLAEVRTLTSS